MSSSEVYASYETAREASYESDRAREAYENAVDIYLSTALGDAETDAAAADVLEAADKAFLADITDLARIEGYSLYHPTASVSTYHNHVARWVWSNDADAADAFEEGWNMGHTDWMDGVYPKALQKPERSAS
jgi:hypothetical protein